jgi:hypothetical protein
VATRLHRVSAKCHLEEDHAQDYRQSANFTSLPATQL